jgi:hypothetical protein
MGTGRMHANYFYCILQSLIKGCIILGLPGSSAGKIERRGLMIIDDFASESLNPPGPLSYTVKRGQTPDWLFVTVRIRPIAATS